MVGYYEENHGGGELSVTHTDPFLLELNRLQNQLKEKDREMGNAHTEIKALRASEALKYKAIEELQGEVNKLDEKLGLSEDLLEHKNLETQKLINEVKDALAAQHAAEATLRRVYANQKDDDVVPLDYVIAPLEAKIKLQKNGIASLQDDKKALERLTKSKESALLEAERIWRGALERALVVEEVQNQNFELKRQIEICQDENRILDKSNRQKVLEVEKLSQTIHELEEALLAGGAVANASRDYQRQISELHEERRTLERELARYKVSANRVANVVANEWKDENEKVMPVKQWLEEKRLLQADMQRLREKLAVSERTAKAETQLKEKLRLRLKTLEDGLKHVSSLSTSPNALYGSPKKERSDNILGFIKNNGGAKKRSTSQPRVSTIRSFSLPQPNVENEKTNTSRESKYFTSLKNKYASFEKMPRNHLWVSRSKVADTSGKENTEMKGSMGVNIDQCNDAKGSGIEYSPNKGVVCNEDVVSGFLYDRLQKEVINLRKCCEVKENSLNTKEQEIKMLVKKVEALTKAMEVESKRIKKEVSAREREAMSAKADDNNIRSEIASKRVTKVS